MTNEQVKFYGEMFKELGLTELKIVNRDEEIFFKKDNMVKNIVSNTVSCEETNSNAELSSSIPQETESNDQVVAQAMSNNFEVKAPLVGIYYAKPSPSAEAFVKVGDFVNKGDVLCIIEAMKMFNEIKAEVSGTIAEICVNNGNVVEYGQTLFKIAQ